MRENALALSINDITHALSRLLLHFFYFVSTIPPTFAHLEKMAISNENVYMLLIDFSFCVEPSLLNNSFYLPF